MTQRMMRLVVDAEEPDAGVLREVARMLREGAVAAYPTDTLYGLAVDPRSEAAVRRLFAIKERDAAAAIPLIAADVTQAREAGVFGPAELRLAAAFWPGPLTIVVPAAAVLTPLLSPQSGSIGVRVPAHAVARALAEVFGCPVTATSANVSGRPPARTADRVLDTLGDRVDVILDGGSTPGGLPSTIVEMVGGRAVMHRAGALAWERVLESLE